VAFPFFLTRLLAQTGCARWLPAFQRWTDGGAAFLPYYSKAVLASLPGLPQELVALRQGQAGDTIDLATATPHFDLVPSSSTKLPADRRGYPPFSGLPELQAAVADHLRDAQGLTFQPANEVHITAGVTGAFQLVLQALLNQGDGVALFDPCSPLYTSALRQRRLRARWVPTRLEDGRICFERSHLTAALRGARLIVVNAPANPTGGLFGQEELEQIAWWARRFDTLIFQDGVCDRCCYEGTSPSILLQRHAQQRTLTAGSISLSHGLAAARVGWLVGHRHLLRPCVLTAALQGLTVPTLCQQIAVTALQLGQEALEPYRADFASRRQYAFDRLQALGLRPAWPAGGFWLWVPVGELGLTGAQFAEQLLRLKKVQVWPGHHCGPSGSRHMRISFAAEDGRLRQGLARLGEFVRQLQAAGPVAVQKRAA